VDEAYYWTWSKESVVSFLDHPPMVAWCVRFGTSIFGDTNFGVRFTGFLAMPLTQLILADLVWRSLRDFRYVATVVLLPEAAPDYGFLMAKIAPDTGRRSRPDLAWRPLRHLQPAKADRMETVAVSTTRRCVLRRLTALDRMRLS
jgi:hypothetical protein